MTQRREVEARLALYGDLSGILGAMRSFALAELRRIAQHESAQQLTQAALKDAFSAIAPALPERPAAEADNWLLLGSVRGFCASFNEDVLHLWSEQRSRVAATIVIGERLQALMPTAATSILVPGAVGAADAASAIDRILASLASVRSHAGLIVCYRDDHGATMQRLWPLAGGNDGIDGDAGRLPVTNEPPAWVAAGVAQHLLFHRLLSLLLRSLRVENHMRLMQMENALQHIDRARDDMLRKRNQLRQGEIVEEIELILRDRKESFWCPESLIR